MEEKKNHWTKKKINEEVYKRDRQASIYIKQDGLAIILFKGI